MIPSFRWIVCGLGICLAVDGCAKKHADEDEDNPSASPPVVAVTTAPIVEGSINLTVEATGKTEALRKIKVFSPIAGKILSLKILEGSTVHPGDVIAEIQARESYAAVSGAEALLASAKTPDQRKEAERTLALAQSTQNTVTLHAKYSGVVATRSVSEGELVTENAELVTLLDISTIVFTADVPLPDLPSLHVGQRGFIQFRSLPAHRFSATVEAINPQTDIQSQTVKVRLRFADLSGGGKTLLKSDMAGSAAIVIGTHRNALLIPKSALMRNDETGAYSIVIAGADSLSRTIPVQVMAATDSTVEVAHPDLRTGMNVIVAGNYALPDSTRVAPAHREER